MVLSKDFVRLKNVVSYLEDVERPHYNYLIDGHEFSLLMQKNIDSAEYQNGLTKVLYNALQHNQEMVDFIKSKKGIKNLILDDLKSFGKIRKFLINIQEQFSEPFIEKAMSKKYGTSDNLVDVVSVNFNRNELRLRLNYQKDKFIHHGILANINIINVYVSEQEDKQVGLAEYLEVFNREYKKNNILQDGIKDYQRSCFLDYVGSKDVLADKALSAKINNFATSVAFRANGIMKAEKFEIETKVKNLSVMKEKLDSQMREIKKIQKERDNRYFGLGKFIDRFINTEEYDARIENYRTLQNKKLSCDREIDAISVPSVEKKRFLDAVKQAYDKEIAIINMTDKKDKDKNNTLKVVKEEKEVIKER